MKILKVLKFIPLVIYFLVLFSPYTIDMVYAERFFQTHNTWYEPIPDNPRLNSNSQNYIDRMSTIKKFLGYTGIGKWGIPIYYAKATDPLVTVKIKPCSELKRIRCDRINNFGWDLNVPMPLGARGAVNADGPAIIIGPNRQFEWDLYQFDGLIATRIKRHDLSGDGVYQPLGRITAENEFSGNVSVSPVPRSHGLITYAEMKSGVIDHAIYFGYGGVDATRGSVSNKPPRSIYPAETTKIPWLDHQWTPWLGHRFQLDPTLDINDESPTGPWGGALSKGEKIIVKALQTYGMIYIENSDAGNISLAFENLSLDPTRSWRDPEVNIFGAGSIPINKFRLIEPLMPPFESNNDTIAAPTGLIIK